jgi:hypothetical protein
MELLLDFLSAALLISMEANRQRKGLGAPDGGQFAAQFATESSVELQNPIDNSPSAVAGRQQLRREQFARAHAGESCPRVGRAVAFDLKNRPKLLPTRHGSVILRGSAMCMTCGNESAAVQRPWSGPGDRKSFTWVWAEHEVPRT